MLKIARVFPRRTKATPDDDLAFIGEPGLFIPAVDAVHVSVAFTWDLPLAQVLSQAWSRVAPVTIGGPATGTRGEEFEPGQYLRRGYVITSRGCPNRCWFCGVWRREGHAVRELPIRDGWNVLDDNILACSENHVCAVLDMLRRQPERPQFTGGLEAKRLQPWHADGLRSVRPKQIFFAFDENADWDPLVHAAELCWHAGFTKASHCVRAYVLCGFPRDTFAAASKRMEDVLGLGVVPMAMIWRDDAGRVDPAWRQFQRRWARPAIICSGGA